jgi:hypothetical protein
VQKYAKKGGIKSQKKAGTFVPAFPNNIKIILLYSDVI